MEVNVGEQEAVITVALPEATRANSLGGALDNNVLDNYDLRFILEIYQGEDCYRDESISDDTTASFEVRLVPGHEYKIAVWADFVANGAVELAENDIFYNTNGDKGLQNITILNNAAMTEARDAYYGTYTLTDDKTAASIPTITLKRPFAKVRVITNDLEECAEMSGMVPASATVTYAAFVNDQFNVLTGAIGSSAAVKTKTVSYATEDLVYDASNLFVDYILVDQTKPSVVKFDLNVTDIVNRSFNTDIAVEANKITTIIGNILTDGTDINVKVDGDFADKESEIPAELLRVLQNGGEYTLTKDLKVYRDLRVNAGADVTLNLGGKTIEMVSGYEEANGAFVVEGNLTIEGEGTVKSTTRAIWTWKGNTVIKGGKFIGTSETIYASAGGKVEIFGGEFEATVLEETSFAAPQYTVLNHQDNNASITVYGGSFKNFNPENNFSEGANTNFCAEGCVVTENDDWFVVTYDPYRDYTKVSTLKELKDAVAVANSKIVFLNDITGDVEISKSVTIDGNGKTYTGAMALYTKDTHVTLKNVNFDGKGYNGYAITTRGAYYLTIEDCTAKNYGYGFVQLASATVLTTVKDVTVSNMNYGVKVDYSNAVVIENADITAGVAAVLNSNYGEKPITIKNSKLNILGTWTRNNTTKTNYVFEGNNSINRFLIDATIDNFKLAAGATLTAPNEITVTTVDGYKVEYADGKYISNENI